MESERTEMQRHAGMRSNSKPTSLVTFRRSARERGRPRRGVISVSPVGEPTMTRAKIAGGAVATLLVLLALAAGYRAVRQGVEPAAATSPATPAPTAEDAAVAGESHPGFLYGRVTAVDGATYEGRLRWGGDEEAFWGDSFNGVKGENPWAAQVPPERLPKERRPIEIFGVEIAKRERQVDLSRPFMARFGDIARIEADGSDLRVTLKSGTVFHLDRLNADDFGDGLRVWDRRRRRRGPRRAPDPLRRTPPHRPVGRRPGRLHGTVHTRQGDFTGFVQWDRAECVGTDELVGRSRRRRARPAFRHHPFHRAPVARQRPGDARSTAARWCSPAAARSAAATAGSSSTTRATAGCWSPGTPSSASTSAPAAAAPPTATSRPGARSPAASPPAPAAASPAGWSTTSTRARPPTPSTPRPRA